MTDREIMQQALDALKLIDEAMPFPVAKLTIKNLRDRLAQPQMQPCAGRNCGSTNPSLHSAECFEDYEKSTGMAQPEQEPVACQYAKDVAMPEYRCAGKCQYAQPEQEQWDAIPDAFNEWWNADYDDTGNPYRKDSPAYWAWSGWKAASKQPEQEPVAWEDVLGAIARGWTHDDNKHKTMDVQLAVAIAKEIQDMVIAPPQRKPLTEEEIERACVPLGAAMLSFTEVARAIEAAHGIKGNT